MNWAMESGVLCTDEFLLSPVPNLSRQAWCHVRCQITETRLVEVPQHYPLVLINHFPLRQDLVRLPLIPQFSIWYGTRRIKDWHRRFRVAIVITGHLHRQAIEWRDGVRFEEVSLGYPRQWRQERGIAGYLRETFPGPQSPLAGFDGPR